MPHDIDDGGPAWPTRGERHPNALRDEWIVRPSEGMSVRMVLAKEFMAALLREPSIQPRDGEGLVNFARRTSRNALVYADALIAENSHDGPTA